MVFNIVNDKQTTDELNWDEYLLITIEPFVSVLIVALYNTLSLCKLLYVSVFF